MGFQEYCAVLVILKRALRSDLFVTFKGRCDGAVIKEFS